MYTLEAYVSDFQLHVNSKLRNANLIITPGLGLVKAHCKIQGYTDYVHNICINEIQKKNTVSIK
jgi:hypothetical protein